MRNVRLQLLSVLAIFGLMTGIAPAQSTSNLPVLRVAAAANDSSIAVLYAQQAGLFRKAGIDVQITKAGSGSVVAAAVAGGATDIGISNVVPMISAHVHGLDFMLVAAASVHTKDTPDSGLVVLTDSPLRSPKDLNGKTIGVPGLNDIGTVGVSNWIDNAGGDATTLHYVEVSMPTVVAALQAGRIDAGIMVEPLMSQAIGTGKVRYLGDFIASLGPTVIESAYFTTGAFFAKNSAVVERFANIIKQASVYCNAHHQETVAILAAFSGADPSVIARSKRPVAGTSLDVRYIQPTIDAAAKYHVIPQSFDARALLAPVTE